MYTNEIPKWIYARIAQYKGKTTILVKVLDMAVVSINEHLETFRQNLKIFEQEQNFKTLKDVLQSGIKGNADLNQISNKINDILSCDDELFWSSRVEKENWLSELLSGFWEILAQIIPPAEVDDDFIENLETNPTNLLKLEQKEDSAAPASSEILDSEVVQAFVEIGQQERKRGEAISSLLHSTRENKCRFFPQPYILMQSETEQNTAQHMKNAQDLSTYFEKYFCSENSASQDLATINTRVSNQNIEELIKIFASIVWSRFHQKYLGVIECSSLNEFLKFSLNNATLGSGQTRERRDAERIIISINLIMACQLYEVNGKKLGIFSDKEIRFDFWEEFSEPVDTINRILVLLPIEAVKLLIRRWMCSLYSLSPELLSQISISERGYCQNIGLKRVTKKMFLSEKTEMNFFERFFTFAFANTRSWHFEMEFMHHVNASTHFFLTEIEDFPHVENSLSDSLSRSDKKKSRAGHLMPLTWIDDYWFSSDARSLEYSSNSHPALHGLHFCADPASLDTDRWLLLAQSFLNFGNPYYASTLMSLFLECRLRLEFIFSEQSEAIDLVKLTEILGQLSKFSSFEIIQNSIIRYLNSSEQIDGIRGCIAAFVNNTPIKNNDLKVISFKEEWQKVTFAPLDFDFSPLSAHSAAHFQKALQLIGNQSFVDAGLSSYAFIEAALGLEAELKNRMKALSAADMTQFESRGLKLSKNREVYSLPLGGLLKIVRDARFVARNIQNKIPQVMTIIQSQNYEMFMEISHNILRRRNSSSHSSKPSKENKREGIKVELQKTKKEILDDGFLEILCETAF